MPAGYGAGWEPSGNAQLPCAAAGLLHAPATGTGILKRIDKLHIGIVAMVSHGQGDERRALDEPLTANSLRHASRPLPVWSSDPQCPRTGWQTACHDSVAPGMPHRDPRGQGALRTWPAIVVIWQQPNGNRFMACR